ncbi:MAG: hypothetical protein JSU68_13620 [Phycisphaerales bacterium]|nr:MAG: hypothetical protein JSU68_13620 [Phycisphaerales bacterium]
MIVLTVLSLWELSKPLQPSLFSLPGAAVAWGGPLFVFVVFVDYMGRALTGRNAREQVGAKPARRPRRFVHLWLVAPLCLAVILTSAATRWPLRARFGLSRPALEEAALAHAGGRRTAQCPRWIGLYRVLAIRSGGPDVVRFVTGAALHDCGFAFYPERLLIPGDPSLPAGWCVEEW